MRTLIILLCLLFSLQAKVLTLKQAFGVNAIANPSGVFISFILAPKIHLYKDMLKLRLNKTNITSQLNYPKAIMYEGKKSFTNKLSLFIPAPLIEENLDNLQANFYLEYQGCSEDGFCYLPAKKYYQISKTQQGFSLKQLSSFKQSSKTQRIKESLLHDGFWLNIASFFVYGLLLSLTPCILPMIPILSSLVASKVQNGKKHGFFISLIYVFAMSLAYALIGVLVSFVGLNIQGLLQNPYVLGIFAFIFVFLAFCMFGVFSLQMPSRIQVLLDRASSKGGFLGVFIMGFLSALIVGPCIAPPLAGALLYITQSKDLLLGASSLFVMSFGMGVPLLLIGLGGSFLRPGEWMDKVKFFFGFLLLGMAIWLISRILPESITYLLYGLLIIFFVCFMGLFSPQKGTLSLLKKGVLLCILSLGFILFASNALAYFGFFNNAFLNAPQANTHFAKSVKHIQSLNELDKILKAQKQKKILLYYTASWCTACKLLKPHFAKANLSTFDFYVIDLSKNTTQELALMKKYNIFGPPAIVILSNKTLQKSLFGFDAIASFLKLYTD